MDQQIAEFYERYPYPRPITPKEGDVGLTHTINSAGTIGVLGCGTSEAVLAANQNPEATIYAMDVSRASLAISRSICRHLDIRNVHHMVKCVTEQLEVKLDHATANGVLHHVREVDSVIDSVYQALHPDGTFSGMVYSTSRPAEIRIMNEAFRRKGYSTDQVVHELAGNSSWFERHVQHECEIADTWLHPYFVEYSVSSLQALLARRFKAIVVYPLDERGQLLFWAGESMELIHSRFPFLKS